MNELEELMQWFHGTETGEILWTMLVSMAPIVELRGGLPIGVALGLDPTVALCASIVGNLIPVPFIIIYIRRISTGCGQKAAGWMTRSPGWRTGPT